MKNSIIYSSILLALLSTNSFSAPDLAPSINIAEQQTNRFVIKYSAAPMVNGQAALLADSANVTAAKQGITLKVVRQGAQGTVVVETQKSLTFNQMQALTLDLMRADKSIVFAEPDVKILAPMNRGGGGRNSTTNDPLNNDGTLWSYEKTDAGISVYGGWDISQGEGVNVAVLDTGIVPHPDLQANLLPGYDMVSNSESGDGDGRDNDPYDNNGAAYYSHGSHVAGTIAAVGNNFEGLAGVAYKAKILPVRVLGGGFSDVADGIIWAAGGDVPGVPRNMNPAQVINMSLGARWHSCMKNVQQAIDFANSKKVVVVVAAMNDGVDAKNATPANCSGVISVAATDRTGAIAGFSNFGKSVTIAAPGEDIVSVTTAQRLGASSGTSMAAPHVAGVAALIKSVNPSLSSEQIYHHLQKSAKPFNCSLRQCDTKLVDTWLTMRVAAQYNPNTQYRPFCRTSWEGSDIYSEGSTITWEGRNFRARWWNTAIKPDVAITTGAWEDQGKCGVTDGLGNLQQPDPVQMCKSSWATATAYTTGQEVSINGRNYYAKWWTQGQNPSSSGQHGPWTDLGVCKNSY